jgi:hypothetical protein
MAAPKESRSGRRLGLRREVLILLPVSLLVLVVLSTFTLFSFRNALQMLGDERRAEAAQAARSIADYLAVPGRLPTPVELRRLAPAATSIVLVDSAGLPLLTSGELPVADPLAPVAGEPLEEPLGVGPDGRMPDTVAGFAPLGSPAGRRYVRVDLPAEVLGRQSRAVQILTVVVLAINSSLVLLVLVFLRHLLAPARWGSWSPARTATRSRCSWRPSIALSAPWRAARRPARRRRTSRRWSGPSPPASRAACCCSTARAGCSP